MPDAHRNRRLDVFALLLAGAVDLLAGADAGLLLADGTLTAGEGELAERAAWVADHTTRWQAGWAFWFVVTTTFAWGFYALARNLGGPPQWLRLAVGAAIVAAAVDVVGIVLNLAVLPDLAADYVREGGGSVASTYASVETLAQALTDITAFGFYTLAGLLLLPGVFATRSYPRVLAWFAAALWIVSAVATALLALDAPGATAVFGVALLGYPVWAWGSAWWLLVLERLDHVEP